MTPRNKKLSLVLITLAGAAAMVWLLLPRHATPQPIVAATEPAPAPAPAALADAPAAAAPVAAPVIETAIAAPPVAMVAQTPTVSSPAAQPPDEPRRSSSSEDGPPTVPTPPAAKPVRSEAAATAQMYAAHAPLRTPEVADPDSKSNRQILQTMLGKALHSTASAEPNIRPQP